MRTQRVERRTEWLLTAGLVATGALLRFWNLGGLGLTHFDEGSYTMAGRWLATLGKEGAAIQAGHSPALFPSLVGLFFAVFGCRDIVAIAVSAAAGSLTVGLVYWLGRLWLGKSEGVLAALFLAGCEYHLMFSRMALTDATFTLLFWAALGALWKAVESGRRSWAWAGGLLTGLCWNTKYHGFFPLLIMAGWLLLSGWGRGGLGKRFKESHWGRAALIAVIVYLPWVILVEATIGYGPILRGQLSHAWDLAPFSRTTPAGLAFYLAAWMSLPLLAASLLGMAWAWRERRSGQGFLVWTTLCFAASTFLYMSFPRLALPLVPGLCLLAGLGVVRLSRIVPSHWQKPVLALIAMAVIAAGLGRSGPLLQKRTDVYRRAAAYLEQQGGLLITQLSKNYYFYETGFVRRPPSLELRWQDLGTLRKRIDESPSAVIAVDPVLHRLADADSWLEELRPRLRLVQRFKIDVYDPIYYQGIDPTRNPEELPRTAAPLLRGRAWIEVFEVTQVSSRR